MTAQLHHLPVTVDTAILTCTARAEREGREPIEVAFELAELARERTATARVMVALCQGRPAIGDAAAHQREADRFAAEATTYSTAAKHFTSGASA